MPENAAVGPGLDRNAMAGAVADAVAGAVADAVAGAVADAVADAACGAIGRRGRHARQGWPGCCDRIRTPRRWPAWPR
ncbi:hypothetical protein F2P44_02460 [Massilia sp. CCM 8695]|uniref:Uncharacterized protein n=1 Tax=Massilia frigida TaxID=2609281 RepID=A0ABX0N602_9BURK|nr:hypothetical protein [Massilia frigida]